MSSISGFDDFLPDQSSGQNWSRGGPVASDFACRIMIVDMPAGQVFGLLPADAADGGHVDVKWPLKPFVSGRVSGRLRESSSTDRVLFVVPHSGGNRLKLGCARS